jgi:hypothetical protein
MNFSLLLPLLFFAYPQPYNPSPLTVHSNTNPEMTGGHWKMRRNHSKIIGEH